MRGPFTRLAATRSPRSGARWRQRAPLRGLRVAANRVKGPRIMIDPAWRPPILETERLRLRPCDESDVDALFAVASNPNVTRYTTWEAHRTPDDTRLFLRDYAQTRFLERVPDAYALVLKHGGALIGGTGARWA